MTLTIKDVARRFVNYAAENNLVPGAYVRVHGSASVNYFWKCWSRDGQLVLDNFKYLTDKKRRRHKLVHRFYMTPSGLFTTDVALENGGSLDLSCWCDMTHFTLSRLTEGSCYSDELDFENDLRWAVHYVTGVVRTVYGSFLHLAATLEVVNEDETLPVTRHPFVCALGIDNDGTPFLITPFQFESFDAIRAYAADDAFDGFVNSLLTQNLLHLYA